MKGFVSKNSLNITHFTHWHTTHLLLDVTGRDRSKIYTLRNI